MRLCTAMGGIFGVAGAMKHALREGLAGLEQRR